MAPRPAPLAALRRLQLAGWLPLLPGSLWLIVLFLMPLLGLVVASLSLPQQRFGLELRFAWNWGSYGDVVSRHGAVLLRSLGFAGLATAIAALLGYPLAWVIAFRGGRWRGLLLGLVVVPFFTSTMMRAIAWTSLLADEGPLLQLLRHVCLNHPFQLVGLLPQGRLLNTAVAVVGGITYNALPLMVLPIVVGMERIDPAVLEAAADLHAGPAARFWRVVWPLSLPGLGAGTLLSLIPSLGDVISPRLLGGPNDRMVGNAVENLLLVQLQLPQGSALAVLLMLIVLVPLGFWLAQPARGDLLKP